MARPSRYTKTLAAKICCRIAEGESLGSICRDESYPAKSTIFRWLLTGKYPEFRDQYVLAREIQSEGYADEILDIADDGKNDYIERELDSGVSIDVLNTEHLQRSRLRVDSRKWILSKLLPKKYGDKLEVEGTHKVELPRLVGEVIPKASE